MKTQTSNNTITAPKGFLAAGFYCGIKKSGKFDLGLLVCPTRAKAAAVFTTNKIVSAAVTVCRKHIRSPGISAVIVNSGNANACTGQLGLDNAIRMCAATASLVAGQGTKWENYEPRNVLIASTGIIGQQLPIQKIIVGLSRAPAKLSASAQAGLDFARAIMTTDTKPKQAVRRLDVGGARVTIAGAVKGAGMIAPNMATTLCFMTTDAAISKRMLASALKAAVDDSLNRLTVDGHQSTNDTAIILASCLAGNQPITGPCPPYEKFADALGDLCKDLAGQMALDVFGTTRRAASETAVPGGDA